MSLLKKLDSSQDASFRQNPGWPGNPNSTSEESEHVARYELDFRAFVKSWDDEASGCSKKQGVHHCCQSYDGTNDSVF